MDYSSVIYNGIVVTSSMTDSSNEFVRVRCIFYFWGKLSFVCSSFAGVPSPWCGDVWKNPLARNMLRKLLTQRNCQQEVRYSIQHSFSVCGAWCFILLSVHWKDIVSWSWLLVLVCSFEGVWWRTCKSWVITLWQICSFKSSGKTDQIYWWFSLHSQAYSFICPIKYSPPNTTCLGLSLDKYSDQAN